MNASHVFLCENDIGAQGDIAVLRSYEWISPQAKGPGKRKKFLRSSKLAVRFSRWVHEKSEGRPIFGTIGQFPDGEVEDLALDKKLSIAVVPVLMGDRWWGFIGFADYSGEIQWSEEEIAPLGAASEILGAAIEREEKERALEETHVTIRDQERFLAGVFDAIQDGIMVAAPDMTILRVNKTIEKRFPHAPTLPGRKCYEAYYGLNSPCSDCASQETLRTGKAASMTRSITGPDGESRGWVEVFSYPWVDYSTGQLKGVIEYSRDITERKRAEEAQRQSEERLQTFLNSFRDPVFLKDSDRKYLFVNEAGLSLLGRTREEIIGKMDSEMFDASDAAEKEKEKTDLRLLKQAGSSLLYEQRIKGRVLETTKFRVNLENGRVGIGGILRDVTEQRMAAEHIRRSEELLRTFIDSSRDYIFLKDELGRNILLNRAVREYTGLAEEDLEGRTDAQLLPPAVAERSLHSDRKVLEAGKALTFQERDRGRIFEVMKFPVRFADDRMGIGGIIRDVTERQEAEEALRSSESRFRELADMLPVGIFEADLDGIVHYANSASMEMFGYGAAEVEQGINFLVVVAPDEHETAIRNVELIREGVSIIDQEYTMVRREGSRFPALTRTRPIVREGRVVNFTGTVIDITERKRAEEALRASEARYRELADNMPAGIYEATLDGRVIYANRTALDMFGYSADEVEKGVNFKEIIAPEAVEELFRNVRKIHEGAAFGYEYAMVRRDGRRFFGLNMARPMIKDGRVVGSTGIITDVSELREAREALRKNEALLGSILRAAPIGVGMVHDRIFAWVNDGMTVMTGYAIEEIKGKSARMLYTDDGEFERAGRENAEIAAKGKGAVETRWRRKDGTLIDVHLSSALIDPANVEAGVVFTALDITAQKKAARILLFAKEDLEKQVAEQMRELDVANMLLKIELEEHRKTEEALVKSEHLYRAIVEDQTEII
ncbi:MAG: PAS domain S-box protein, partial [Syntrophaceae bacterium]